MTLYDKICAVYPQLVPDDFLTYISLRNDGDGDYIAWWAYPNLPAPTQEQLDAAVPPPPPFVWPQLTPLQFALQLQADGNLSKVQPLLDSLTDPLKTRAQLGWDRASVYLHDDPVIVQLAPLIGYDTPDRYQAFFVAAALL